MRQTSIFISYSHHDRRLKQQLIGHLSVLQRQGLIGTWHDGNINAGSEIDPAIAEHLGKADIILLLVSATFLASDYCWSKEMKAAIVRHDAGGAVVSRSWKDTDEAFNNVTRGLRDTVNEFSLRAATSPTPPIPRVNILLPTDGSQVARQAVVSGSVTDPSLQVWVIVHPESHLLYWVQAPAKVEQGGSWTAGVCIGSESVHDVGSQFEIRAVAGKGLGLQAGQQLTAWPSSDICSETVRVYRARQ
jgi:hypothetical protein